MSIEHSTRLFPFCKRHPARSGAMLPFVAGLMFATASMPVPAASATPFSLREERQLVTEMEQLSTQLVGRSLVPGMAWVMVSDGELVAARGFGVADVHTRAQVNEETVFRLASLSKGFASAVVAQLHQEGLLSFQDRVIDLVPGLNLPNDEMSKALTIEQLLSHRGAFPTTHTTSSSKPTRIFMILRIDCTWCQRPARRVHAMPTKTSPSA
jgi:CubicO group peptidase (beta-lactamase class C family)